MSFSFLFALLLGSCSSHSPDPFDEVPRNRGHGARHHRQHKLMNQRASGFSEHSAALDHSTKYKEVQPGPRVSNKRMMTKVLGDNPIWKAREDKVLRKVDFNTRSNLVFVNCTEINTAHAEHASACLVKCEKTSVFPTFGRVKGNIVLKTQSLHNFCRNTCGCQVGYFGWCNRNIQQQVVNDVHNANEQSSNPKYTYGTPNSPDLQSFAFFVAPTPLADFHSNMCQIFPLFECSPDGNRVVGAVAQKIYNQSSIPMQPVGNYGPHAKGRRRRHNVNPNPSVNIPYNKLVKYSCQKNPFHVRDFGGDCFPYEMKDARGEIYQTNASCLQASSL